MNQVGYGASGVGLDVTCEECFYSQIYFHGPATGQKAVSGTYVPYTEKCPPVGCFAFFMRDDDISIYPGLEPIPPDLEKLFLLLNDRNARK